MTDTPEYILNRVFDAPRALVWKAWTDPKLLARWYGPGVETIIHHYDLREGGEWRNEMIFGERSNKSVMSFQEVVPEEKLVWQESTADADWNPIANPMMENWPTSMQTAVSFMDEGDKTKVRLVWTPVNATEEEKSMFTNMIANMGKGWESGFGIIDEILGELQS